MHKIIQYQVKIHNIIYDFKMTTITARLTLWIFHVEFTGDNGKYGKSKNVDGLNIYESFEKNKMKVATTRL